VGNLVTINDGSGVGTAERIVVTEGFTLKFGVDTPPFSNLSLPTQDSSGLPGGPLETSTYPIVWVPSDKNLFVWDGALWRRFSPSPLTTKGDLYTFDGTQDVPLPVGTDDYYLKADSTTPTGLLWDPGPVPGGNDGDVQWKLDATHFGGSDNFVWDDTTNLLTILGGTGQAVHLGNYVAGSYVAWFEDGLGQFVNVCASSGGALVVSDGTRGAAFCDGTQAANFTDGVRNTLLCDGVDGVSTNGNCDAASYSVGGVPGVSGTFLSADATPKTVTVVNGQITGIV
jgi:hypothetical protein